MAGRRTVVKGKDGRADAVIIDFDDEGDLEAELLSISPKWQKRMHDLDYHQRAAHRVFRNLVIK